MTISGGEILNVTITKMELSNFARTKTYDISKSYANLKFLASMYNPTIRGEIHLIDSYHILDELPLVGEEWLDIEYSSSTGENVVLNFFVYKLSEEKQTSTGTARQYKLHLIEQDQLLAISTSISRGYNTEYSNVVKDVLFNTIRTNNTLNYENTKGVHQTVIPFYNCWETIEFARSRSFSVRYKSPFVFFQDFNGYNFCSLEYLAEQRLRGAENKQFYYEVFRPGAGTSDEQYKTRLPKHFKNITNLHILKKNDSTETINNGGYQTHSIRHDIFTKEISVVANTSLQEFTNKSQKNVKTHTDAFLSVLQNRGTYQYVVPYDSSLSPSHIDELLPARQVFNTLLRQIQIRFDIPADSNINPGDIIIVHIPSSEYSSYGNENLILSGKYIVSDVNVFINNSESAVTLDCYKYDFDGVLQ
jgi:hypothetical protein